MSHLGQRLSAFIDGELNHQQRVRVLAHLARCEPCRREAASLRMLKQRMHALGEATADTSLTERLIAVAGVAGPAPWGRRLRLIGRRPVPGLPRRRWPARSLAVASLTLVGLGIPAAAFLAGGGQQEPGPSITPAIDVFLLQHEISTGNAPLPAPVPPGRSAAGAAPAPATPVAPTAPPPSAAGVASPGPWPMGVDAALTRMAAVSSRVAAAATSAPPGPSRRPQPAITAAGTR